MVTVSWCVCLNDSGCCVCLHYGGCLIAVYVCLNSGGCLSAAMFVLTVVAVCQLLHLFHSSDRLSVLCVWSMVLRGLVMHAAVGNGLPVHCMCLTSSVASGVGDKACYLVSFLIPAEVAGPCSI